MPVPPLSTESGTSDLYSCSSSGVGRPGSRMGTLEGTPRILFILSSAAVTRNAGVRGGAASTSSLSLSSPSLLILPSPPSALSAPSSLSCASDRGSSSSTRCSSVTCMRQNRSLVSQKSLGFTRLLYLLSSISSSESMSFRRSSKCLSIVRKFVSPRCVMPILLFHTCDTPRMMCIAITGEVLGPASACRSHRWKPSSCDVPRAQRRGLWSLFASVK
mmetsp:Transcript_28009/g.65339  ORF Transcript_28009/g.65339 Transcript_28009/m.65339 type:complete len:217 (-) Transcript_28009:2783-3433(-)